MTVDVCVSSRGARLPRSGGEVAPTASSIRNWSINEDIAVLTASGGSRIDDHIRAAVEDAIEHAVLDVRVIGGFPPQSPPKNAPFPGSPRKIYIGPPSVKTERTARRHPHKSPPRP